MLDTEASLRTLHAYASILQGRLALARVSGSRRGIPEILSERGIAGGAVYDALVALAAVEHDAALATRDARATATYEAIGAHVIAVSA